MKIYLTTDPVMSNQKWVLDAKDYPDRLLSYFFLVVDNKRGNKDLYLQNRDG